MKNFDFLEDGKSQSLQTHKKQNFWLFLHNLWCQDLCRGMIRVVCYYNQWFRKSSAFVGKFKRKLHCGQHEHKHLPKGLNVLRLRGFRPVAKTALRKSLKVRRKWNMESFSASNFFLSFLSSLFWIETLNCEMKREIPFSSWICLVPKKANLRKKEKLFLSVVISQHFALNFYKHFSLLLYFYDRKISFFLFSHQNCSRLSS